MSAKKFFYVAAGILLLVIAYSIGASRVQGQSPNPQVATITTGDRGWSWIFTTNGDMYVTKLYDPIGEPARANPTYVGNIFSLPSVGTGDKAWSTVKGDFRK